MAKGFLLTVLGIFTAGYIWHNANIEKFENKTQIEGTVFKPVYINAVPGSFWNKNKDSEFSFSIDSGRTLITVEPGDRSLEEIASQIKEGTKVGIYVSNDDLYKDKHEVETDYITIK